MIKKWTERIEGTLLLVHKQKVSGDDVKGKKGFQLIAEGIRAATPRGRIEGWRPLAEKYGVIDRLEKAEALLDSKGSLGDYETMERFDELMALAVATIAQKSNEQQVYPLARDAVQTKQGRQRGGEANKKNPHFVEIIEEIVENLQKPTPANVKKRLRILYRATPKPQTTYINDDEDGRTYLCCSCDRCKGRAYKRLSFENIWRYVKDIKKEQAK